MAGEPSLFLVYQDFSTDERTGVSWHGTQAAADAAATASGAGFTAHQGAITVPNHFTPGLIYNPTLDTWRRARRVRPGRIRPAQGGSDGTVRQS